jgi:hypothetical protein
MAAVCGVSGTYAKIGGVKFPYNSPECRLWVENGPFRRLSAGAEVRKDRRKSGERILEIRDEIVSEATQLG